MIENNHKNRQSVEEETQIFTHNKPGQWRKSNDVINYRNVNKALTSTSQDSSTVQKI